MVEDLINVGNLFFDAGFCSNICHFVISLMIHLKVCGLNPHPLITLFFSFNMSCLGGKMISLHPVACYYRRSLGFTALS